MTEFQTYLLFLSPIIIAGLIFYIWNKDKHKKNKLLGFLFKEMGTRPKSVWEEAWIELRQWSLAFIVGGLIYSFVKPTDAFLGINAGLAILIFGILVLVIAILFKLKIKSAILFGQVIGGLFVLVAVGALVRTGFDVIIGSVVTAVFGIAIIIKSKKVNQVVK